MRHRRIGVFSRGIRRLPGLKTFLDVDQLVFRPSASDAKSLDAIVGWGHKSTARQARDFARRHGLAYVAIEDGFLRSVGIGPREPPLSLVVDDLGIYYDARQPSRLEALLAGAGPGDPLADEQLLERARRCRQRIVEAQISKYNHSATRLPRELASAAPQSQVLVIDQTRGDASVDQGLAGAHSFAAMLEAARREHPGARILVKAHPEVISGVKSGYLANRALDRMRDVQLVSELVNPIALIQRVCRIYVCTSLLGFEALMAGVPVSCFGAPFYAGWGLTADQIDLSQRRRRTRSLDELVAAALLLYPRYLHPITHKSCTAEDVIEHLAVQRRMFRENARSFVCLGFSRWKRPFVRRYLAGPESRQEFADSGAHARELLRGSSATLLVWGSRPAPAAQTPAPPLWRIEDGFLRSVRLGSELTPPGSLVVDTRGIYYDPRTVSDLELLLQNERFTPDEIARAAALRRRIVEAGLSKYNPPARARLELDPRPGQSVVLVPGQVEDDASVLLGSPRVRDDRALLEEVRRMRPDAYVVYKPHPDVVSGNRRGRLASTRTRAPLWDALVERASLPECLAAADEVHTMTSLVGFEALLREIPVVVWGQPFYAGWGLTEDKQPVPRRSRRLSIDELVAGCLIRYPRYYSFRARAFCTPEAFVEELCALRDRAPVWLDRAPRPIRRVHALVVSLAERMART